MKKYNKINKKITNSALYTIGTVIGQGMTFLGGIVFVRLMSQVDFGLYSTYYATVAILVVFVGANLYVPLNNAYIDFKKDINTAKKAMLSLSILVFFAVLIITYGVLKICMEEELNSIYLWAPVHAYAFFLVNYEMTSANMENRCLHKMLLLMLPNFFQFLFSVAFILLLPSRGLYARTVGSVLGVMVCGIIPLFATLFSNQGFFAIKYWRYGLKISLPSIFSSISAMIMQHSDRIMITRLAGANQTAVYSFIYYIGYAVEAVDQAVKAVIMVWMYKALDEKRKHGFIIIQKWYLLLIAFLITGMYMVSPDIIILCAPPEYWEFNYSVPFLISVSIVVCYGFYSTILSFHKKTGQISICVSIAAVVNVFLNMLLIPHFGAISAGYTTVVSSMILFVMLKYASNRCSSELYNEKLFYFFIGYTIILGTIFILIKQVTFVRYLFYGGMLIIMMFYVYNKRHEVYELIFDDK